MNETSKDEARRLEIIAENLENNVDDIIDTGTDELMDSLEEEDTNNDIMSLIEIENELNINF